MNKNEIEELPKNHFDRVLDYIKWLKQYNTIEIGTQSFEMDEKGGFTFKDGDKSLSGKLAILKFIEKFGINGVNDTQVGLKNKGRVDCSYVNNLTNYVKNIQYKIIIEYQKRGELTSFLPILEDICNEKIEIQDYTINNLEESR